ncbi:tetratricopeptide repeat protein 36 [Scyliorhinus canicula]|uniref:tetratricopeptide repeat protein 36 n=1 Tax=Scyliorhinus canicula TaxID=7830 RepID=UPI0018F4AB15|nr:tetratricopeptide repeat protein 36 [Scyliorhinus canicula]
MATLSDQMVLQVIFNPNNPYGDNLGLEAEVELTDDDSKFDPALVKQAKDLELHGISLTESGNVDAAVEIFSQAIAIIPERASGYNNRAQTLRLKGDTTGAMSDLNKAVELSRGRGRTASLALVQRGILHRLCGQDQEALQDFKQAAELGNGFAKGQVTLMNPYAALCNRMLAKMVAKLRNPGPPASPSV